MADRRSAARVSSAAEVIEQSRSARGTAARPRRPRGAPARASRRRTDHDDRARQLAGHHRPRPRRRVSGAARTVRRRRHGAGAAGARQHSLRRRRRAGIGRRHGQGRRQARLRRTRAASGEVSRRAAPRVDRRSRCASRPTSPPSSDIPSSSNRRIWDRASAFRK